MRAARIPRPATALLAALLAAAAAGAAGPQATVLEPVVDVGRVVQGDDVIREFKIQNSGDADLEITEVSATCGCTVASFARTVKPGRIGLVRVVLSTGEFRGPIAKGVTAFTSDPANPRIHLVIKAVIEPLVEVSPGFARFIVVQGEAAEPIEQVLRAPGESDFRVTKVTSPYPFVRASLAAPDGEGDDAEWKVTLDLDERRAPIGPMADFVVVQTNHPKQKQVKIPLSGFVRPPVVVVPQVYDFGERKLDEEYPGAVEVKVVSASPVRLGEVTTEQRGLVAEVEELEAGRLYNVVIRLRPEMPRGKVEATLSIATDNQRFPVLEIPVTGKVL